MSWIAEELTAADLDKLRKVTIRIMRRRYNRDLLAMGRMSNTANRYHFVDQFIESLGPVTAQRLLKRAVDAGE